MSAEEIRAGVQVVCTRDRWWPRLDGIAYPVTAQGDLVPWLCSQTDLLASDWELA